MMNLKIINSSISITKKKRERHKKKSNKRLQIKQPMYNKTKN